MAVHAYIGLFFGQDPCCPLPVLIVKEKIVFGFHGRRSLNPASSAHSPVFYHRVPIIHSPMFIFRGPKIPIQVVKLKQG